MSETSSLKHKRLQRKLFGKLTLGPGKVQPLHVMSLQNGWTPLPRFLYRESKSGLKKEKRAQEPAVLNIAQRCIIFFFTLWQTFKMHNTELRSFVCLTKHSRFECAVKTWQHGGINVQRNMKLLRTIEADISLWLTLFIKKNKTKKNCTPSLCYHGVLKI